MSVVYVSDSDFASPTLRPVDQVRILDTAATQCECMRTRYLLAYADLCHTTRQPEESYHP